jgi:ATP-binding cassette subfamily F protein uup
MDRIVDHVLAFEGEGKVKDFVGNFSEYRESQKSEDRSQKSDTSTPQSEPKPTTNNQIPAKKKLSFKEQRELETIEKKMPELEAKRTKILEKLNNESDYEQIAKLSAELESISEKLEEHEMRWLELQEMMG